MNHGPGSLDHPPRILIVDNERQNRELLEVMLTREGYLLSFAASGEAALAMIADQAPDLILLDVVMPSLDGYRVAAKVKENVATKNIPIIMVTGLEDRAARMRGLSAGAEDFLSKPVDRAELCLRVRNLLRLKAFGEIQDKYSQMLETEVDQRTANLAESEARFRQLADKIPEVVFLADAIKPVMFYVNPAYEEIWGRTRESLYAHPEGFTEAIHPDDSEHALEAIAPNGTLVPFDVEFRIMRPDRTVRNIEARGFPIFNPAGAVYRIAGIATDITERKHTEEALVGARDALAQAYSDLKTEVAERITLEGQFREAQKMEAVGRLSGGIAHDFNNLLTVILGHAAVLEMFHMSDDAQESVAEIKSAGERAANLTRQLLLFARREAMQMSTIDLNATIAETIKMLGRILGEDVHLEFRPWAVPLFVHADPGMMDQVVMNLAVNARDAMPGGGRLVIETTVVNFDEEAAGHSNQIRPGTFVLLSVADSGVGIPVDVLPKIFEPFFTTKDVGKGTGLGLATAFGIVQQHAGWISAHSEGDRRGSTFRVYLPCVKDAVPDVLIDEPPAVVRGGNETILLVEDEPSIREMVAQYLRRLGYAVLTAGSGPEALIVFGDHKCDINLLMTDIVMPGGMTGVELAGLLIQEMPGLRVIYTSGYNSALAEADLSLSEGFNFLSKPFALSKIAVALRLQLDPIAV